MKRSVVRGLALAGLVAGSAYVLLPFAAERLLPALAQTQAEPAAGPHDHAAADDPVLYWRDPSGRPAWSAVPRNDESGRAYLPVHDSEEPPLAGVPAKKVVDGSRTILYYRNPMGLPDVSPTPKKDPMGMDYVPVYDGDEPDDGGAIKVSLAKVQRSGVRTEPASARLLVRPVRGVGTVTWDERRLTTVTVRSEAYVEDLFVDTTGASVCAGQPLFRIYSKEIQLAQVDLNVSTSAQARGVGGLDPENVEGAMQRLRNLGVPESHIAEVRKKRINPRTIDWVSPTDGVVIEKKIVNGQRVMPGDELYRIADLRRMWVIAEVSELDLAAIAEGMHATVTLRAYPNGPLDGTVTFIYPDLRPETRTARVRIELDNRDGRLRNDMYADVVFHAVGEGTPSVSVPESAVIDSGSRKVVFVSKEEGRFEPRDVRLGQRADGFVEILDGVADGEPVVTTATFLIDSESNLNAALKSFGAPEPKP
ncbi:putative Co/Zn/Cd efflux system membrane fusion protein [Rhodovulum sp. PH10]|uniref:efflux RND transporter periplasmic adaptor subunit n=1 Tax=Rhodovulum sp. PH10 TaxID=1187851 RepID=UPI00027C2562|nr:efflux RND transporter periplasmic adaptor subunit [Rhodovulum sp. PH10]EJW10800.1 putative Co/Zn/Cd efflux system membrane fusion protein [Rhodovulum sp. PH10]